MASLLIPATLWYHYATVLVPLAAYALAFLPAATVGGGQLASASLASVRLNRSSAQ